MHFPILATFLTFLVAAIFAIPMDQSPATSLVTRGPGGCTSPACILVTFADMTQLNLNNVQNYHLGKEVRGVLVADCTCALWSDWNGTDLVDLIGFCPGVISEFKRPVRAISCVGWHGDDAGLPAA